MIAGNADGGLLGRHGIESDLIRSQPTSKRLHYEHLVSFHTSAWRADLNIQRENQQVDVCREILISKYTSIIAAVNDTDNRYILLRNIRTCDLPLKNWPQPTT